MKRMKKIAGLLLALVMVLGMTTTAFAEEVKYTITAPAVEEGEVSHTYVVYQIFTGTLSDDILSDVKWGLNGSGNEGEAVASTVLEAIETVKDKTNTEKLEVINLYVNFESDPYGTIKSGETLTDVPAGYYLIKDKDDSLDDKDEAYTTYIVEVAQNVTINAKSAKPTVDKEVNNDGQWGDSADADIKEDIQFRLTATLPVDTDFADYETYKVVFHDTMSSGITFKSIESVTVNGISITNYTCTATAGQAGGSWTLTITDLKTVIEGIDLTQGAVIVVTYNAYLNENAEIGNPGNENTVILEYSNNPNVSGEGDNETTKTPEEEVVVFTYELEVTKVDGETDAKLKDAQFVLYREKDGKTEYVQVDDNGEVTGWTEDKEKASVLKSNEQGLFVVSGLDAGTYKLEETKAPEGYNTLTAPIELVISATTKVDNATGKTVIDTLKIAVTGDDQDSFDGNAEDGTVATEVKNNKGATLPETGGIGTTIFYVLGAILLLGSVVLFITKKRMSAE